VPVSADVLVVGGGPVGVATGLLCAHRGLAVTVLERETGVYDLPRAIVMDHEIQRVLQGVGLIDELRAITTPLAGAEFLDPAGQRIMGIDLPLDAPWPLGHHPVICYYQPELEAFLRNAARRAGVELRLGATVRGVGHLDDGAWVDVDGERLEAPWVVAADGASSPIRKALGIAFESLEFDQDWLVVDTELTTDWDGLPRVTQQLCDPHRPATYVPGHARYRRWEFQVQPDDDRNHLVSEAGLWELLGPWMGPDRARIVRAVIYRFHATVAATMGQGRVLLAGDAAHQMPPFLGQGLCSGLRDSANLAWKVEAVARGWAGPSLLDTYDLERRPHAIGLVGHAADTGRLIDELAGRAPATTGIDAAYGGERPFPHLTAGILAGEHPLCGQQLPQPRLGGRPLDDLLGTGWAVLARRPDVVPAEVNRRWSAVGGRVVVCDDPALAATVVPLDGATVVRPDRYVAAVADGPTALAALTDDLLSWYG
jgi:3-(3-hydroxy-phenyl)propionate hydroxylase